ncbi:MAG: tetratricopeptide repeat protein [Elusimicrobiota bacterium]
MTGDLTGAVADLDTVIAADPGDDEAVIWRAEARLKLGRRDDARRDLDLAAGRGALWAFALRARLALDENRLDAARSDFAQLMPPVYEDVPDEGHTTDRGRHLGATVDLDASRLSALLDEALAAAGGVRRSDAHLNRAWMSAAGASPARRPAPGERLSAWWALKGIACRPVEPADPADEKRAGKILR